MVEVTLFEIDLQGSSFSATPPFGRGETDEAAEAEAAGEPSGGPGRGLAVVLGLLFLLAVAVVIRRTLDGEGIEVGS